MKKFENFKAAYDNMADLNRINSPEGPVEIAGMVALFEICFEQAWKTMKECLEVAGYGDVATGSPRAILKTAYRAGMIEDEDLWLDALVSRNNVSHSYNREIAMDIINKAKTDYYSLFGKLKKELENNWI